mgnify:CR=1 FL=1
MVSPTARPAARDDASSTSGRSMLDEAPPVPPTRRVSPVARALRPLQPKVGALQAQIAFLIACNLHSMRQPSDGVGESDVVAKRRALADALVELEAIVASLPSRLRADGRVADMRAAIARLDQALDILDEQASP